MAVILFSIPVHEKEDIVVNLINNIKCYNPNSIIIIHVNKLFSFDISEITNKNIKNVFVNPTRLECYSGKGLLHTHISNYHFAKQKNMVFDYIGFLASNEMFIKPGLEQYVEQYDACVQIEPSDSKTDWHLFNRGINTTTFLRTLLSQLTSATYYGGQAEGQIFKKSVFENIIDVIQETGHNVPHNLYETEEIICQTIIGNNKNNLKIGSPVTLQNYCHPCEFSKNMIDHLRQNDNIVILGSKHKYCLISPHFNKMTNCVFSIKRVDRSFCEIRNYLTFLTNSHISSAESPEFKE